MAIRADFGFKQVHKKGGSCITRLIWILHPSKLEKPQTLRSENAKTLWGRL